jgi:Leucine-rich repeat (LRR) protein
MLKVEEIQTEIESLSEEECARLRIWFSDRDWEKWDKQIEIDSKSGKLDFLIKESLDEKAKGNINVQV